MKAKILLCVAVLFLIGLGQGYRQLRSENAQLRVEMQRLTEADEELKAADLRLVRANAELRIANEQAQQQLRNDLIVFKSLALR